MEREVALEILAGVDFLRPFPYNSRSRAGRRLSQVPDVAKALSVWTGRRVRLSVPQIQPGVLGGARCVLPFWRAPEKAGDSCEFTP